jgi:hypothetical protein
MAREVRAARVLELLCAEHGARGRELGRQHFEQAQVIHLGINAETIERG